MQEKKHNVMKKNNTPDFSMVLTAKQAADSLEISTRWFYELVKKGIISQHISSIGKSLLWDKQAIDAIAKKRRDKK